MPSAVLAITSMDRLGAGLLALLLCMLVFIVSLFVLIALGRVWRRMTLGPRARSMAALVAIMFLLAAGFMIGVPHTSYDYEIDATNDDEIFIQSKAIGVTSWFVHRIEDRTITPSAMRGTLAPIVFETSEVSLVGILAVLPALAVLVLLARWQWRNLPGFYRRPQSRCDHCDYDLRGFHSPVCPECGEVVT